MITMEPMLCAVDDETYLLIDALLGREVAGKLLYDPPEDVSDDGGTVRRIERPA